MPRPAMPRLECLPRVRTPSPRRASTHTHITYHIHIYIYIHHPGERAFLPAAPRLGGAGLPRRDRVRAQAAPGQRDTMLHPLTTLHLPLPRYAPLPRYILSPRCIPSPRYISLQDSASQHELHVLQLRPQAGLHTLACRRPVAMLNPLAPPPPPAAATAAVTGGARHEQRGDAFPLPAHQAVCQRDLQARARPRPLRGGKLHPLVMM